MHSVSKPPEHGRDAMFEFKMQHEIYLEHIFALCLHVQMYCAQSISYLFSLLHRLPPNRRLPLPQRITQGSWAVHALLETLHVQPLQAG